MTDKSQNSMPLKFEIKSVESAGDLSSIRTLFTLYTTWLNLDLSFQNYSHELSSLPGLYAPPTGALFLATTTPSLSDDRPEAIGCIALRPLKKDETGKICEIKRLYTLPECRGFGVGKALIKTVLEEAKRLGYSEIKLDTLPRMEGAIWMYQRFGFRICEAYYETPLEGTIFLERSLD